jgi:hypothetical protein
MNFLYLFVFTIKPLFIDLHNFKSRFGFNNDSPSLKADLLIFKLLLCSFTEPSILPHDSERIYKK